MPEGPGPISYNALALADMAFVAAGRLVHAGGCNARLNLRRAHRTSSRLLRLEFRKKWLGSSAS